MLVTLYAAVYAVKRGQVAGKQPQYNLASGRYALLPPWENIRTYQLCLSLMKIKFLALPNLSVGSVFQVCLTRFQRCSSHWVVHDAIVGLSWKVPFPVQAI